MKLSVIGYVEREVELGNGLDHAIKGRLRVVGLQEKEGTDETRPKKESGIDVGKESIRMSNWIGELDIGREG